MRDKYLFAKSREGYTIKVGRITRDENTGEILFIKNRPHFMKVVGGYGIQKYVEDETGKKWDLQEVFRKHPELKIVIKENGKTYVSQSADWIRHYHKGNYGDGEQMFLSVKYMKDDKATA